MICKYNSSFSNLFFNEEIEPISQDFAWIGFQIEQDKNWVDVIKNLISYIYIYIYIYIYKDGVVLTYLFRSIFYLTI
jgi:hypothetical protein